MQQCTAVWTDSLGSLEVEKVMALSLGAAMTASSAGRGGVMVLPREGTATFGPNMRKATDESLDTEAAVTPDMAGE